MPAPLIAHVLYRFDVGGLENGVVNLLNRIPSDRYRHAIVCLSDYAEAFRERLADKNAIPIYALHKRPGRDPSLFGKLYRLFRELRPHITHTRNFAAFDALLPALLAGVKHRVHGEHGRDVIDLDGTNKKQQWLRRLHNPLVNRWIALSKDLESYLVRRCGVAAGKVTQIYNGVDTEKFRPSAERATLPVDGFAEGDAIVIGSVSRLQAVKDPLNLVRAFIELVRGWPQQSRRLRLALIGGGPLHAQCLQELQQAGLAAQAWLPGDRADIAELMRAMDIFVLPSLGEGISNTVLEAQASGLPVVATRVGGTPEIVIEGVTALLVAPANPPALAAALRELSDNEDRRRRARQAARDYAVRQFSMEAMVQNYLGVYDAFALRSR